MKFTVLTFAFLGCFFHGMTSSTAQEPPVAVCPTIDGAASIYAIGSSTMGGALGTVLKAYFKDEWGLTMRKWGKASTGLARPDFHDWLKEIPSLNRRYDPDIYLISLGTNDAQPIRTKRSWIRKDNPKWEVIYAERVDKMLGLLAGEDKKRMVIWLGPTAWNASNSRAMGPKITRILRDRIAAFGGNTHFIDVYAKTSPSRGVYIKTVTSAETGKKVKAWGRDRIHLSRAAAKTLLAIPIVERVAPCLVGHGKPDPAKKERPVKAPSAAEKTDTPSPTP